MKIIHRMPQMLFRAFISSAVILAAAQASAAPFAYLKPLKEAEDAIGPLKVFANIDALGNAERHTLLMDKSSELQRLGTRRSLSGDANGAAVAFSW